MLLSLSVAAFTACTIFEPVPMPSGDYSIIAGDTVKTVKNKDFKEIYKKNLTNSPFLAIGDTVYTYKEPKLHTAPNKDPDLSKIKNEKDPALKGKPLTMVVIGGSLSAGVRDGGYFNEGMLTSYPNLVARQMKLKKFELPLFDATEYNGTGRMAKTNFNPTGGPVQKYNAVSNNIALSIDPETKNNKVKKYKGDPDNLAVAYTTRLAMLIVGEEGSKSVGRTLMDRINIENRKPIIEKLKNRKNDIFILESGMDNMMGIIFRGLLSSTDTKVNDLTFKENLTFEEKFINSSIELQVVRDYLAPTEMKGVLLNLPNLLDLPLLMKNDVIKNNTILNSPSSPLRNVIPLIYRLLPSSKVDSMLSPKVHISLKPGLNPQIGTLNPFDYLTISNDIDFVLNFVENYNNQLISFNKKWGYPIVDIKTLYAKVLTIDGFKDESGVSINTSNFFSDDKIYPSAFGQAVIANEVIKAINSGYKTNIETINIREYLTK